MLDLRTIRLLREAARFAKIVKRKRDGAVTRAYLAALPDEIGKRITAAPTVVKVLPTTWTHADSLPVEREYDRLKLSIAAAR